MNTNSTEATEPTTEQPTTAFACPKCDRTFKSTPALRMHEIRKHSNNVWHSTGTSKRRKYKQQYDARKKEERQAAQVRAVQFCPRCGCNIKAVEAAVRFASEKTS